MEYDRAGQCLRATRSFVAGEVIVEEAPALMVEDDADDEADPAARISRVVEAFRALPRAEQEDLLSLYKPDRPPPGLNEEVAKAEAKYTGEEYDLLQIMRVNEFAIPGEPLRRGMYVASSRNNHSCRPNILCARSDLPSGTLQMVALRDIDAGEELCHSYLNDVTLLRPAYWRRRLLLNTWGFRCGCPRCSSADDVRGLWCPACGKGKLTHGGEAEQWGACPACGAAQPASSLDDSEDDWLQRVAEIPRACRALGQLRKLRWAKAAGKAVGGDLPPPAELDTLTSVHGSLVAGRGRGAVPIAGAHWLVAALDAVAAEAHLLRGRAQEARAAARRRQALVRRAHGPGVFAREAAAAVAQEAAAAELEGDVAGASELYRAAMQEAAALRWDNDELVAHARERLEALGRADLAAAG